MSWDDTENYRMGGAFEWPSLKEVHEYRTTVRDVVSTVIASTPIELPITMDSPLWVRCSAFALSCAGDAGRASF